MDSNNFTPLPQSLDPESTVNITKKSHHINLPDIMLFSSFIVFVISVGFWVQSTLLQPETKATQKIIDVTATPTPTLSNDYPAEISPIISEIPE
ncbi:hypothetical protein A2954_00950 [Candidatus Roizmanbacteria bacterium RIFCSPLOWO2_01_FULL_37_12]|uniref:Uncharacterized protein n=1 Tax=Candidatus Roizmanbacteria bacterium RIFCSPLOWO2_01_FULL_37_12 TaxID=1802056 RepID=A0A1F7IGB2_9BACT|nr:MAG: hypothetical protein A3D76_06950 [Candidatus Roizmanbacteria bacterium RIFCSPHIGHO2_02_FULL_37_9b]OGK42396.1 MAG: hypothetical protein A2954_00950 [Candidatus Roizmanbacteria bacterium RIFCSPLOWO2_01_FULL_37_12]